VIRRRRRTKLLRFFLSKAQDFFACGKERSRDQRADPDITPGDLHIRQKLENHCEEQSNDRQREDRVEDLNQRLDTRDKAAKPLSDKRDDRCKN
jgi:hypothetical protein